MNISAFTIYLWQLADKLIKASEALCFLTIIITASTFIAWLVTMENGEEPFKKATRNLLKAIGVFFTALTITTLIPDSKTIAMMLIVPEIAQSKVIQQDVPELYNMAIEALKSTMQTK